MKSVISAAVVLSAVAVSGATYRTNNVEGLVYLLKTYSGRGHTVELEAGDYCLREDLTWATNANAYVSHLHIVNTHLKGVGDSRDSVRLIGCGTMRVMLADSNSTVANLTITNGYAALHDGYGESNRGGGVYGGALVTNCVIIGNTAEGFGGGGGAYVRFVTCLIKNNIKEELLYSILLWIGHNYGTQEMEEPCYDIESMVNEIMRVMEGGEE